VKLLVTGGAGFIGSHLVEAFLAGGHDVTVVDNLSTGRRENVPPHASFHHVDIRDARAVEEVVAAARPDLLCHHAAESDFARSTESPAREAEVNVVGSLNLLDACRRAGVRRVVFASSGAAGGEPEEAPLACAPRSPYGASKLAIECYLEVYRERFGMSSVALRYANVYGGRSDAGVVARFAASLAAGEPATIEGDGKQTRDFVFVGDVVAANVLALERELEGVFDVGTGIETSIGALYETIRELTGGPEPRFARGRAGEPRRSRLSPAKLEARTGWRPATPLAEGLAETIKYYKRCVTR
jgi:UDP-glucose 4-epimerase